MAPNVDIENDCFHVPWDELATLWRHKGNRYGPGSQGTLAAATLREIVRFAALMRPSAQNSFRIALPN